jgi:hypothetical protein
VREKGGLRWLGENWTGSLGERERESRRRECEARLRKMVYRKKKFVNRFPFFTKGFSGQRN